MGKDSQSDKQIQLIILGQENDDNNEVDVQKAAWDKEMATLKSRNFWLGCLHMFNFVAGFSLS
jgi:hypothetical protein